MGLIHRDENGDDDWSEPSWYENLPQQRADLYFQTLKELLDVKDKDLENKFFPEADEELLELLKERLSVK